MTQIYLTLNDILKSQSMTNRDKKNQFQSLLKEADNQEYNLFKIQMKVILLKTVLKLKGQKLSHISEQQVRLSKVKKDLKAMKKVIKQNIKLIGTM